MGEGAGEYMGEDLVEDMIENLGKSFFVEIAANTIIIC